MTTPPISIETASERSIFPIVHRLAIDASLSFDSCLDIGCGRSRHDRWFSQSPHSAADARYIGLETDPEIVADLRAEGVDVREPSEAADVRCDLTLCVEVIEHILEEDAPSFLAFARDSTRKLLALTTPNFEHWSANRALGEYKECRWIPDHLPFFNVRGGPHSHKQRMTPDGLYASFEATFDEPDWDFRVYRAWPWRIEDVTRGKVFEPCFKLFALAWRNSAVPPGTVPRFAPLTVEVSE